MNKKLLTLAVAAATVGGLGAAQADVTVYGKAHVSIDRENSAGFADNTAVSNNSSRLGFKFSDDLGGGLKAMGQYETAINIDGEANSGTGIIGGARNSFLALSSDMAGTLLSGIYDTPFKSVGRAVELFPEYIGDARNITAADGWDLRVSNVIAYASPNLSGFSAVVATVTDTAASNATDNNKSNGAFSASAAYSGGPVYVGLAYEQHNALVDDAKGYRLAASGTFGMFKVIGMYQKVEFGGATNPDRSSYGIGGSATLAEKHVIKAQYYKADSTSTATTDNGASMYVVGYDYKFSKKTTGYVAYAKTSNDAAGAFLVSNPASNQSGHGEGLVPTAGNDVQATSIGLYTEF